MKLSDIPVSDVLAGNNWIFSQDAAGDANSEVREAIGFAASDVALCSSVVRFADASEHAALVVKSFPQGGDELDIYVTSKHGWINIHAPGFMRALGKYHHEVFPFDYFLALPWRGGRKPEPDMESPHIKQFKEAAARIKKSSVP